MGVEKGQINVTQFMDSPLTYFYSISFSMSNVHNALLNFHIYKVLCWRTCFFRYFSAATRWGCRDAVKTLPITAVPFAGSSLCPYFPDADAPDSNIKLLSFQMDLICNYGTGGNIEPQPVYLRGTPCSRCPRGAQCSSRFSSLCTRV